MDDGNWAEYILAEKRAINIAYIDFIRERLLKLRLERPDDIPLFIEITKIIGSLAGLKEVI